MPWKLENKLSKYAKFILPNRTYIVGRLEGDIIANDKSVSRKHAKLSHNPNTQMIVVEDLSKFGTSINCARIVNKIGYLHNGNTLTFGAQPGVDFQCSFEKFDVVVSTLVQSDKVKVTDYLSVIGGQLLNDWSDFVRYLVMSNLKVTYKVICALIKQVPIVTTSFMKELQDYYLGVRETEPATEDFLPLSSDNKLADKNVCFKPDLNRRTLFKHKTFYFLTAKKLSNLELAIVSAGGQMTLITESNFDYASLMRELERSHSIVMYEVEETDLVKQVYTMLKKIGKRPVIDSEIGFAVLHVTMAEYCNPSRKCIDSIYAESNLTQILSVNPFRIDIDVNAIKPFEDNTPSLKRSHCRIENSETRPENVVKKPKISPFQNLELMASKPSVQCLQSNNERKINENRKQFEGLKSKMTVAAEKNEGKSNEPKMNKSLQDLLQNNKNNLGENTENCVKESQLEMNNFDDEFDEISVPSFGCTIEKVLIDISEEEPMAPGENMFAHNPVGDHQPMIMADTVTKIDAVKVIEHRIKLIETKMVNRKLTEGNTDSMFGGQTRMDDKMTKFDNLVVEDMEVASRTNVNFKTFKKTSAIFINTNPIAMQVFNKKNYK